MNNKVGKANSCCIFCVEVRVHFQRHAAVEAQVMLQRTSTSRMLKT